MITLLDSREKIVSETEENMDSELWHACAGGMIQMPSLNSKVFYFPQGHLEHTFSNVDLRDCPKIPSYVHCRVSSVKFMADSGTDEVFAKIRLSPIVGNEADIVDENDVSVVKEKQTSFAKALTQSDANNGGGFSVPRYCADTIFPRLDYNADPPVQTLVAKDVHGESWSFRHIYRGTPRRHLLTTGWSSFVNRKKLVAGDSVVFLKKEKGDLCIGIRRAKRGTGRDYYSPFTREGGNLLSRNGNANPGFVVNRGGVVKGQEVIEAAMLAASGQPFEVVYYPRSSTPEFCVKASLVKAAMQILWCRGMKFKMAFETEDSSRISWFTGTISSVQVVDPIQWPDSPWRLLQVNWDDPDLLQNVKRVNPWLVELQSNMPAIPFSHFSPPPKKARLSYHQESPLDNQNSIFSGNHILNSSNPIHYPPDNVPAGMQGARHAQYGLYSVGFSPAERVSVSNGTSSLVSPTPVVIENVSCLLTIGNSTQGSKLSDKTAPFVLFGQPIFTEEQICMSNSNEANTVSPVLTSNGSSNGNADQIENAYDDRELSSCEGFESLLGLETI